MSTKIRYDEDKLKFMYPFNELAHLAVFGFVERNFYYEEINVGCRLLKHEEQVFEFLYDKNYKWIAEKTIRFIAQLNGKEADMLMGNIKFNAADGSEIDRLIADVISEAAWFTIDCYHNPDPFYENFFALEMAANKMPPEIPKNIIPIEPERN